ncbi:hypothetical protein F6P80_01840 [Streptococcus suis]|nr:hypothetical protein [Streptococcus suis]MBS8059797.1 hypothetical protein [Streptococcus suis]MBS8087455.1 hypothetical protein [Streptococcus suis]QLL48647.1 hypothetical protein DK875_01625 [Streptococcus suis]
MSEKLQWSFSACSLKTREEQGYACGLLTRTPFVSSPSFNYLPELTSCISRKFFYLSSLKYDTIIGYLKVQRRKRWYYQILKKISLNMLNSWFQQVSMSNLVTRCS